MRVNSLLIASLTGAAYAAPVQTVPELSIVQEVAGLTKLPVGPRQASGLSGALRGVTDSVSLDQVTDSLPVSSFGGLRKRQLDAATDILKDLPLNGLGELGKRQDPLEQLENTVGDLSLLGLKERQVDINEITSDKLDDLDILSNSKRQLEPVTEALSDLSLPVVGDATKVLPIRKRQIGNPGAAELESITGLTSGQPLQNLHLPVLSERQLKAVTDLLDEKVVKTLPIAARGLAERQLKAVTDLLDEKTIVKTLPIAARGLSERQLKAVTDLLDEKTLVKALPIEERDVKMQCVGNEKGECKAVEEDTSSVHATNDPKLDVVKSVTDAFIL